MKNETHPLALWATQEGRKLKWLHEQAGISRTALADYMNSRKPAPRPVRLAFEVITAGKVKADEWPEASA